MDKQKSRPIIFSTEMVKAILEGRKTQTRRIVKPQPDSRIIKAAPYNTATRWPLAFYWISNGIWNSTHPIKCPYGVPGDRLWMREGWYYRGECHTGGDDFSSRCVEYVADGKRKQFVVPHPNDLPPHQIRPKNFDKKYLSQYVNWEYDEPSATELAWNDFLTDWWKKKRPSIFMPRWASRITLQIENIRVERLQDISGEDALKEGLHFKAELPISVYPQMFKELWDSINGKKHPWDSNPWVWVIEFRKGDRDKLL